MKHLLILLLALAAICSACQKEETKVDLDKSYRMLVKFNGKYGYCDQGGITIIPPQFEGASLFSEGLASVRVPSFRVHPSHRLRPSAGVDASCWCLSPWKQRPAPRRGHRLGTLGTHRAEVHIPRNPLSRRPR